VTGRLRGTILPRTRVDKDELTHQYSLAHRQGLLPPLFSSVSARTRPSGHLLKTAKWEDHGLIFPNRVGKPMDHNNLYHRDFKSLLKRAGLWSEDKDKRFTFHSLRHTCATLLVSKNVHPKIVQEMLGHATITQTMDTYSRVMPGMSDIAATALEEALG
jgi:integrase